MKRELKVFFTALMFYTRIPCPKWVGHEKEYINLSVRYFPLIGWIVGAVASAAFWVGDYFFSASTGVLVSLAATVLTTGAFHEDGFADVCDGFGGGWTKDKILLIMKDSRVGVYGVVGLVLLFGLKVSLLMEVASRFGGLAVGCLLVAAHAMSRFVASTLIFTHAYVRDTDDSKAKPVASQVGLVNLWVGLVFAILPFIVLVDLLSSPLYLLVLPAVFLGNYFLGRYYSKWIGGYTGDCLGAAQQVAEVVFIGSTMAIWKFI